MSESDRKIWSAVLAHLRENTPALCRKWFEDIEPLGFRGGVMDLCASQNAHRDYLATKCVDAFNDAFQSVTGHLVSVRFLGPDELAATVAESKASAKSAQPTPHTPTTTDGAPAARQAEPDANGHVQTTGPRRPAVSAHSAKRSGDDRSLDPDYTFDSFIQGPNNRLAHAAAMAICEQPGHSYNPMFIHGNSSVGKTHLLQAVCHRIIESNPNASVLYITCEGFLTRFHECVHAGKMDEFRHTFRDVDLLAIDDIHFLSDREQTQEEFFHTFNELHQARRQILLTSDRPPHEIPILQERLVSRFQWGLVAPIDFPDYETRVEIVRSKARMRGADIPADVAALIAAKVESDVRKLEGELTNLQMQASLAHREIDLEFARVAIGGAKPGKSSKQTPPGAGVTIKAIVDAVTSHYNVTLAALQSKRRQRSIAEPRQVCMYLAREFTRYSLEEVGTYFGGRDHTTVLHAVRAIKKRCKTDESLAAAVDHLYKQLDSLESEAA